MNFLKSNELITLRQHGAMEHSEPPCDLNQVRRYRLNRIQEELVRNDLSGIILYDQLNTRYATDATNMQLWCSHNEARYVYVPATSNAIIFEYGGKNLLSEGLPGVERVEKPKSFFYMSAGQFVEKRAREWAEEMDAIIRDSGRSNKRVAIDRISPIGVREIQALGYEIFDGFTVMEKAREIKSPEEILLMRKSINVCEDAVSVMRENLKPGITENELWSELHKGNIAGGGEWIETRLLSSGPRTNPWFRECSMRVIEKGDMVSFDTDLIGPYGYCCDMSRSWVCDAKPDSEQKRLYAAAYEQIKRNMELLKPGLSYKELSQKLHPIEDKYLANRYGVAMHGVGLCDEAPSIYYPQDYMEHGYDGVFQEGMVVCVEALVGVENGRECVKLEEQVLITSDGFEQLTTYPLEDSWL